MLEILYEFRRGILFIRLEGDITKDTYIKYKSEVIYMIMDNGIRNVVINLGKVRNIDLKGINTLFYTYELLRDNRGILMLTDINSNIEERILKSHITNYIKTLDNEIDAFEKIIV
ncbi:MAG: STAS domain-containing protein [Lactobacillales bacterium]|nr:STAS domain-containing protein [Lactobacillales bacterium]